MNINRMNNQQERFAGREEARACEETARERENEQRSGASAAMCRITSSAASQSYLYSDSPLIWKQFLLFHCRTVEMRVKLLLNDSKSLYLIHSSYFDSSSRFECGASCHKVCISVTLGFWSRPTYLGFVCWLNSSFRMICVLKTKSVSYFLLKPISMKWTQ